MRLNNPLRIALISILLAYRAFPADQGGLTTQERCDAALKASYRVIQAQDTAISHLKASQKDLLQQLQDAKKAPALPTWAIIGLSVLAGGAAVAILRH